MIVSLPHHSGFNATLALGGAPIWLTMTEALAPPASVVVPGTPAGVDIYGWTVRMDRYSWSVPSDSYGWSVKRDRVEI